MPPVRYFIFSLDLVIRIGTYVQQIKVARDALVLTRVPAPFSCWLTIRANDHRSSCSSWSRVSGALTPIGKHDAGVPCLLEQVLII
jgi:hypothetical protein